MSWSRFNAAHVAAPPLTHTFRSKADLNDYCEEHKTKIRNGQIFLVNGTLMDERIQHVIDDTQANTFIKPLEQIYNIIAKVPELKTRITNDMINVVFKTLYECFVLILDVDYDNLSSYNELEKFAQSLGKMIGLVNYLRQGQTKDAILEFIQQCRDFDDAALITAIGDLPNLFEFVMDYIETHSTIELLEEVQSTINTVAVELALHKPEHPHTGHAGLSHFLLRWGRKPFWLRRQTSADG